MKSIPDRFLDWFARQEIGSRFTRHQSRKECGITEGDKGWHDSLLREQVRLGRVSTKGRWYSVVQLLPSPAPRVAAIFTPVTTMSPTEACYQKAIALWKGARVQYIRELVDDGIKSSTAIRQFSAMLTVLELVAARLPIEYDEHGLPCRQRLGLRKDAAS